MALETKFNVFVQVLEKLNIDNRIAYKIAMPSGLIRTAWESDLIFI